MSPECGSKNPLVMVLAWPASENSVCTHACTFYPLLPSGSVASDYRPYLDVLRGSSTRHLRNGLNTQSLHLRQPEFRLRPLGPAVSALISPVPRLLNAARAALEKEYMLSLLPFSQTQRALQWDTIDSAQRAASYVLQNLPHGASYCCSTSQWAHHSRSTDAKQFHFHPYLPRWGTSSWPQLPSRVCA